LKPQAGQRHTACIRYISAPQRSQSVLISPAGELASADLNGVMVRVPLRASGGSSWSDMREIMSRAVGAKGLT